MCVCARVKLFNMKTKGGNPITHIMFALAVHLLGSAEHSAAEAI